MKYIFYVLSLILIFTACSEQKPNANQDEIIEDNNGTCDCNDLAHDLSYNNFYLTEPREGYTGNCKDYYANGQIKLDKNFKNGKVHGVYKTYHENGQESSVRQFDNGFQTGEQIDYSPNGEITFHATYERGNQIEILVRGPNQ
jgi:antitoxin component YwqK of YwqJK toxin-antitoxin module